MNAVKRPEEDRQLYMGLDGKVGTFDALVDYETNATEARSRTPAGLNDKHLGGEIRNGRAVGFHHEGSANGRSRLVAGTETKPDAAGVYRARVEVRDDNGQWITKPSPSTFFPKHWTRSQVRTAILEAFANRSDMGNGNWTGKTSGGLAVVGHSDASGVIDSVYPVREGN